VVGERPMTERQLRAAVVELEIGRREKEESRWGYLVLASCKTV